MESKEEARRGDGLVAILLITRTRPGPRLVFHYPEKPDYKAWRKCPAIDADVSESEDDEEDDRREDDDSDGDAPLIVPDEARRDLDGAQKPPGPRVLGCSVGSLEKVLSPGRWCDRKKFEIKLNGLSFVGHPTYAPEDGDWAPTDPDPSSTAGSKDATDMANRNLDRRETKSPCPPGSAIDFAHVPDSFESQDHTALGTSMRTVSSTGSDPTTDGSMSMFHVVFVLRGQGPEAHDEAQAIYHEAAKKLSKALHYCQKQANYVQAESRRILATRTKAQQSQTSLSDLWTRIVETSELAWTLKDVFDRISRGEVAGIRLNGMEMSLHVSDPDSGGKETAKLGPLSAILLLDSKENLLVDLSHPDASPLAAFIREHTPTKNLQKHAAYVGVPVEDVLYMASHLLKWRKARIISPLHQRNTYVVAPDAPLEDLQQHINAYHKLFPTLPTLPNMLKVLSGKPIKYGLLIPSRDHRTAYMNILSYLVRHGLVVQLKTFGWLKLPKNLVDQTQAKGEILKRPPYARNHLLSPKSRAVDDDVASVSSGRTAIAAPSTPLSRQSRRFSRETQVSSQVGGDNTMPQVYVNINDPRQLSEEQRKLVDALQSSMRNHDLRDTLPQLMLHLDGTHAFEEIAAIEGWKRASVEEWLAELDSKAYLTTVRYIR
ncbi:Nitrogen permease regulator 3 [Cercospora zeina]